MGTLFSTNGKYSGDWNNGIHHDNTYHFNIDLKKRIAAHGYKRCRTLYYSMTYPSTEYLTGYYVNGLLEGYGEYDKRGTLEYDEMFYHGQRHGRQKHTNGNTFTYEYYSHDRFAGIVECTTSDNIRYSTDFITKYSKYEYRISSDDNVFEFEQITNSNTALSSTKFDMSDFIHQIGKKHIYDNSSDEDEPFGLWRTVYRDGCVGLGSEDTPKRYELDGRIDE